MIVLSPHSLGPLALALVLAACSGVNSASNASTGAPSTQTGLPACDVDAAAPAVPSGGPAVSFVNDVFPIIDASCALAPCHGSADHGANQGLYLGSSAASAWAALVNVPAPELPSMKFVEPGSPEASYVMHKLDGDQCRFEGACAGSCGARMPFGGAQLPGIERDAIRRWIAEGAPQG